MMDQDNEEQSSNHQFYDGISRFILCFPIVNYKSKYCFRKIRITTIIYLSVIIDFVLAIYSFIVWQINKELIWQIFVALIDCMILMSGIMGIYGIKIRNANIVSAYYYNKLIQLFFDPIIDIVNLYCLKESERSTVKTMLGVLLLIGLRLMQAYVIYCYVNLAAKGDNALMNNEPNPMEMAYHYGRSELVLQP